MLFGECVYFKPAKTVCIFKDEPKWCEGIYIGFIDVSNESVIGTSRGVMTCRAIRRKDETDRFDNEMIHGMKGFPWQPVPGRVGLRIPTHTEDNGAIIDDEGEVDDSSAVVIRNASSMNHHRLNAVFCRCESHEQPHAEVVRGG